MMEAKGGAVSKSRINYLKFPNKRTP
jgi:hypothetical protein